MGGLKFKGLGGGGGAGKVEFASFIASGTYTVPDNCFLIDVALLGGGGGPSRDAYINGNAGELVRHFGIEVVPGQEFQVIIGSGGNYGNTQGGRGGNTSFGDLVALGGMGVKNEVLGGNTVNGPFPMWPNQETNLVANSVLHSALTAFQNYVYSGYTIVLSVSGAYVTIPPSRNFGAGGGGYAQYGAAAGSSGRVEIIQHITA